MCHVELLRVIELIRTIGKLLSRRSGALIVRRRRRQRRACRSDRRRCCWCQRLGRQPGRQVVSGFTVWQTYSAAPVGHRQGGIACCCCLPVPLTVDGSSLALARPSRGRSGECGDRPPFRPDGPSAFSAHEKSTRGETVTRTKTSCGCVPSTPKRRRIGMTNIGRARVEVRVYLESRASHYFRYRKVEMASSFTNAPRASRGPEGGCSWASDVPAGEPLCTILASPSPPGFHLGRRRRGRCIEFEVGDAERFPSSSTRRSAPCSASPPCGFARVPRWRCRRCTASYAPAGGGDDFPTRNCPWYGPIKKAVGSKRTFTTCSFTTTRCALCSRKRASKMLTCVQCCSRASAFPTRCCRHSGILDAVGELTPGLRGTRVC